jgi:probable HAF family extracellular repeat protein
MAGSLEGGAFGLQVVSHIDRRARDNVAPVRESTMKPAVLVQLASLFAAGAPAFGQAVGLAAIGAPPGGSSFAYAVSADGLVVVGYQTTIINPGPPVVVQNEAIRWTSGAGRVGLGDLAGGATESRAFAASADGSVIVGYSASTSGPEAFRWTATSMVGLGDLAGGIFNSSASGVSADGTQVSGYASGAAGIEGFRWVSPGPVTGLGDLSGGIFSSAATGVSSDGSVIVGSSISINGTEAFRWVAPGPMSGLGDLAGGAFNSSAAAVSTDGSVVVGSSISANGPEAYRWKFGSGMIGLSDLPGGVFSSGAAAVSADGNVIVGYGTTGLGGRAFIWDSISGMRDLELYLVSLGLDLTGWRLDAATGISADGTVIVGYGAAPGLIQTGWVATVPRFCYANCDASTGSPTLSANDFLCFLNKFATAEPYANCDGSTPSPVLSANDFLCFLNAYADGCS